MRIACCSSLSNTHVIFMMHFIKSILKHNPLFDMDYVIFNNAVDDDYRYSLSNHNKDILLSVYPRFKFQTVDILAYQTNGKSEPIYYSIDMFKLHRYDAVIYWGADMLCMGPLDELFNNEIPDSSGIRMPVERRRRNTFNNGSMIVPHVHLCPENYVKALTFDMASNPEVFGHDQKIYNCIFNGQITELPQKWNCLVSEIDFVPEKELRILHYIYKPTMAMHQLTPGQLKAWHDYDGKEDSQLRY